MHTLIALGLFVAFVLAVGLYVAFAIARRFLRALLGRNDRPRIVVVQEPPEIPRQRQHKRSAPKNGGLGSLGGYGRKGLR